MKSFYVMATKTIYVYQLVEGESLEDVEEQIESGDIEIDFHNGDVEVTYNIDEKGE